MAGHKSDDEESFWSSCKGRDYSHIVFEDSACTEAVTDMGDPVGGIKINGVIVATWATDATRPIWGSIDMPPALIDALMSEVSEVSRVGLALEGHEARRVIAREMLRQYSVDDPARWHYYLAAEYAGEGDDNRKARRLLAGRVRDEIAKFTEKVQDFAEEHGVEHDGSPLELDEMLWLDALFFDHLATVGDQAEQSAKVGRTKARERWASGDAPSVWRLWFDEENHGPYCHFAPKLAEYLWCDQVEPELKRIRDNRPALAVPVYDALEATAWHKGRHVERDADSSQLSLLSEDNDLLAQTPFLPDERLQRILEAGADDLRSITAIRLFIYLVRAVHQRAFEDVPDSTVLEFEGGIKGLAEEIGETSNKGRAKLKGILEAGQRWHVTWPGGAAGGLWTYTYDDTSGSHKTARLELRLGAPLAPMYNLKRLRKGQRTLTPIVDMAPLVSPGRYYAPQAAFQQSVVRAIAERSMQIADDGGVLLTLPKLWPIADALGLPKSTMQRALDRWLHDGDDGPAFLEKVDRDRYHLADNERYGLARRFIDETARRKKRGQIRGKASQRKRKGDD
ncbi:MAG: hypothetical protein U5L04_05305 [Trueperaceae bacterium]|nr:hypothetical protein [Trueperaceae bacterium]